MSKCKQMPSCLPAGAGCRWLVPYRRHWRTDPWGHPTDHWQKEEHLQACTRCVARGSMWQSVFIFPHSQSYAQLLALIVLHWCHPCLFFVHLNCHQPVEHNPVFCSSWIWVLCALTICFVPSRLAHRARTCHTWLLWCLRLCSWCFLPYTSAAFVGTKTYRKLKQIHKSANHDICQTF